MMGGYRLFWRYRRGRQGLPTSLPYVREGLDFMVMTVNMVGSLRVRMNGKANTADVAVGLYY